MVQRTDLPNKNDFALAYKAIGIEPNLSGDGKRVGVALISHFNAVTGQCDPGIERLVKKLKSVSRRSVINATNELNRLGLVVRTKHGGNGLRSSYQPNWALFRRIVSDFESEEIESQPVQETALDQCRNVHLTSAEMCTLTQSINSPHQLKGSDGACGNRVQSVDIDAQEPKRKMMAARVDGLLSESLKRPYVAKRTPSQVVAKLTHKEAAADRAMAAWVADLSSLGAAAYADALSRMTPDMQEAATVAELKERGGGLRLMISRLHDPPTAQSRTKR